jgi:hypothetical protein
MQKVYCRLSYAEDDCHAMEQTMNVHELADTIVQRYLAHPGGKMYPELMAQIEPLLASSLQEATRQDAPHNIDSMEEVARLANFLTEEIPSEYPRLCRDGAVDCAIHLLRATRAKDERIAELEKALIEVARFKSDVTELYCWCGSCSDAYGVRTSSCFDANRALSNTSPPLQGATEAGELE